MQWVCLFQDDPKRQFLLGKHGKTMIHHWLLMAFGDNPKSMSRHRTLKLSRVELLNSFEAVLAAAWLPSGKRYAATAFVEATIGGVCPFLSDAFDTMKLHLFSREAVNPIFASSSWIFRNRHQTFFNSQAGSPFPETDSLTKYCLNLARVFFSHLQTTNWTKWSRWKLQSKCDWPEEGHPFRCPMLHGRQPGGERAGGSHVAVACGVS